MIVPTPHQRERRCDGVESGRTHNARRNSPKASCDPSAVVQRQEAQERKHAALSGGQPCRRCSAALAPQRHLHNITPVKSTGTSYISGFGCRLFTWLACQSCETYRATMTAPDRPGLCVL